MLLSYNKVEGKRGDHMDQFYFSEDIQQKLSYIYQSSLTMIEAPAGYGKSTAVRWAMRDIPADQVHWFTAVSFQQDASLDWFIRQIGALDNAAGGAGLGLALVRAIAQAHGGTVRVEDGPAGGSRFVMELPCGGKK